MFKLKVSKKIVALSVGIGLLMPMANVHAGITSVALMPQLLKTAKDQYNGLRKIWEVSTNTMNAAKNNFAEAQKMSGLTKNMLESIGGFGEMSNLGTLKSDTADLFGKYGISTDFSTSGLNYTNLSLGQSIPILDTKSAKDFRYIREKTGEAFYIPLNTEFKGANAREKSQARTKAIGVADNRRNVAYREASLSGLALATARKKSLPGMQKQIAENLNKAYGSKTMREDLVINTKMLAMLSQIMLQNQEMLASRLELDAFHAADLHGTHDNSAVQFAKKLGR